MNHVCKYYHRIKIAFVRRNLIADKSLLLFKHKLTYILRETMHAFLSAGQSLTKKIIASFCPIYKRRKVVNNCYLSDVKKLQNQLFGYYK